MKTSKGYDFVEELEKLPKLIFKDNEIIWKGESYIKNGKSEEEIMKAINKNLGRLTSTGEEIIFKKDLLEELFGDKE